MNENFSVFRFSCKLLEAQSAIGSALRMIPPELSLELFDISSRLVDVSIQLNGISFDFSVKGEPTEGVCND